MSRSRNDKQNIKKLKKELETSGGAAEGYSGAKVAAIIILSVNLIGGLLIASVILPNAAALYARARARVGSTVARRRLAQGMAQ